MRALFIFLLIVSLMLILACSSGGTITHTTTQTKEVTTTASASTITLTITSPPITVTSPPVTVTSHLITITDTITTTPPAPEESFLVTSDIAYIITEKSTNYWDFSWQVTVKNMTSQSLTAYIEVHFLDSEGFSIEWTNDIV